MPNIFGFKPLAFTIISKERSQVVGPSLRVVKAEHIIYRLLSGQQCHFQKITDNPGLVNTKFNNKENKKLILWLEGVICLWKCYSLSALYMAYVLESWCYSYIPVACYCLVSDVSGRYEWVKWWRLWHYWSILSSIHTALKFALHFS